MEETKEYEQDDDDLFDQYEGYGTEDLAGGIPFLSICQKVTEEGMEMGKKLGEWWHSGLNISLGKTVRVVAQGWKRVWVEKKEGRSIKYHAPESIPLLEKGSGKDYTCTNPTTKNKVEKTTIVPLQLYDHDDSLCVLIPTVKSADAMKSWRKALDFARTSSGRKAPIFYYIWELTIEKIKDGAHEYYVLSAVRKGQRIPTEYLTSKVQPLLAITSDPLKLIPMTPQGEIRHADMDEEGTHTEEDTY